MSGFRRLRSAAMIAAALATTGCAQAGVLGDVLGGVLNPQGGAGEQLVQGDVTLVDAQRQYLQVRATNGQVANVRFDNRTQVIYQQQNFPVTALEPGDQISMRIQQTQQGELYTDQILVTRSIQEVRGTTDTGGRQYTRLEGYVGSIDSQRGMFELRIQNRPSVWVSLPYNGFHRSSRLHVAMSAVFGSVELLATTRYSTGFLSRETRLNA